MPRIVLTTVSLFFLTNWLLCCSGGYKTDEEKADALWEKGDKQRAVEVYSKAVLTNFYFRPVTAERAAEFYFENGDLERAEQILRMAVGRKVELHPRLPEVQHLYEEVKADIAAAREKMLREDAAKQSAP